ncbi:hypothetical protein ABIA18_000879 [Sinorhizobium fredii]
MDCLSDMDREGSSIWMARTRSSFDPDYLTKPASACWTQRD